jgi:predicted phosphodiesterase
MKFIQSDHVQKSGELCICPISDLHIGSPNFKEKELYKVLDYVEKNKANTRIILNGDLAETATKTSVGKGWEEQIYNGQEAMYIALKYFKPFKDNIDGITMGNHEYRVMDHSGVDLTLMFARELGIADKYLQYQGLIKYKVESSAFLVHAFHGYGGGGSTGGAVNKLKKQADIVFADVYLMGHVHKSFSFKTQTFVPDMRKMKIFPRTQYYVCTGHSLDYEGGYGEMSGLAPSPMGYPKIFLSEGRDYSTKSLERQKLIRVEI